jgi:two-component system chemotaxis sensor kinase CheA
MALDMAKYRRIFLEEATDHLAEISRALLDLEKEMGDAPAIDTIFRMAHSIKSMAASLGYDPVADLSHRMEDRMEGVRTAGRVRDPEELALLFRSLEALEMMVAAVANEEALCPADAALLEQLAIEQNEAVAPDDLEATLASPELTAPDPESPDAIRPDPVGGEPKKVLE